MKGVLIIFVLFFTPAVGAGVAADMGFIGTAWALGAVATLVFILLPHIHECVK